MKNFETKRNAFIKRVATESFIMSYITACAICALYGIKPYELAHPYALLKNKCEKWIDSLATYSTMKKILSQYYQSILSECGRAPKALKTADKKKKHTLDINTSYIHMSHRGSPTGKWLLAGHIDSLIGKPSRPDERAMCLFISKLNGSRPIPFENLRDKEKGNDIGLQITFVCFKKLPRLFSKYIKAASPEQFLYSNFKGLESMFPLFRAFRKTFKLRKTQGRPRKLQDEKTCKWIVSKHISDICTAITYKLDVGKRVRTWAQDGITGKWYLEELAQNDWSISTEFSRNINIDQLSKDIYEKYKGKTIWVVNLEIYKELKKMVFDFYGLFWYTCKISGKVFIGQLMRNRHIEPEVCKTLPLEEETKKEKVILKPVTPAWLEKFRGEDEPVAQQNEDEPSEEGRAALSEYLAMRRKQKEEEIWNKRMYC